jgi:hypothetical protein
MTQQKFAITLDTVVTSLNQATVAAVCSRGRRCGVVASGPASRWKKEERCTRGTLRRAATPKETCGGRVGHGRMWIPPRRCLRAGRRTRARRPVCKCACRPRSSCALRLGTRPGPWPPATHVLFTFDFTTRTYPPAATDVRVRGHAQRVFYCSELPSSVIAFCEPKINSSIQRNVYCLRGALRSLPGARTPRARAHARRATRRVRGRVLRAGQDRSARVRRAPQRRRVLDVRGLASHQPGGVRVDLRRERRQRDTAGSCSGREPRTKK